MSITWAEIKEFLARLFSRGREGVGTLAESIDRQAAIQRLAAHIRGLRRERQQTLLTIGKKVYALHRRGKVRNRDVLGDCKRIDEIAGQIEKLEEEIAEIRRRVDAEPPPELSDETALAEEEPETPAPSAPEPASPQTSEPEVAGAPQPPAEPASAPPEWEPEEEAPVPPVEDADEPPPQPES